MRTSRQGATPESYHGRGARRRREIVEQLRTSVAAVYDDAMRRLGLLLAIAVAGCGSGVSADKACTDLAASLCTQIQNCAAPLISTGYGDVATCQARAKLGCMPTLMAPGTSATPDKLDKCATALSASTCDALYTRDPPTACLPDPGKLADGAACGDDAQCANKYCKKPANAVCGVCAAHATAGGACTVDTDCDVKLACGNNVCVAYGALGGTCDAGHPCAPPNVCKSGTCAMPAEAGQACTPSLSGGDCDETKGLFCNPSSVTAGVCAVATFAGPGQPCGLVNGGVVGCSGGARCVRTGAMGTCLAPAADGAACDSTNGPDCVAPAECVGGVCKLPDPASCM